MLKEVDGSARDGGGVGVVDRITAAAAAAAAEAREDLLLLLLLVVGRIRVIWDLEEGEFV